MEATVNMSHSGFVYRYPHGMAWDRNRASAVIDRRPFA
jgi:hypothetical protein